MRKAGDTKILGTNRLNEMDGATKQTPTDRIQDALEEKGYRPLRRHGIQGANTVAFTLYSNRSTVLILQEYGTGGCELYKPVTDSIDIQKTIDAIPEAK